MIDQETAIQWTKDAGFEHSYLCMGYWIANAEQIQALITRAQNEAYEKAAECCECTSTAHKIRSMKHINGEEID